MNGTESDLMRLLHGELPEARARELRARLERDPALAEEYRRLRGTWEGLALPPAAPVPPGFSQRVLARARADSDGLSLRGAPVWVRAVAAAALVAGTALGLGVGGRLPLAGETRATPQTVQTVQTAQTGETTAQDDDTPVDDSLAGSYWDTVESLQ